MSERASVPSAAQLLAAQRRRVTATCVVCGAELRDVTTRKRYCSNACAQRARYMRDPERLRALARDRYAARKREKKGER